MDIWVAMLVRLAMMMTQQEQNNMTHMQLAALLVLALDDGKSWTKLKQHSGEKLTGMVKHPVDLAALEAEAILRAKRVQTIEFPAPSVSQSPILLTATASSGLPVTYAVIEGPAKVDGNRLTPAGVGRVRLRAMQTGSGDYYSALPLEQILNVK